ncbi:putative F-box/FBD/LRR-repeat protein At5g44950 isoform X1 [Lolium perenne]|uniref:putative F-box/FBD/LRR-repeat protein At5g44950 isoform X1 n=1 Tax=Lolium perenne TaxID=4522 RepID=UPI0021F58E09|nr:putative F-box/FBD/LRR-repeat protein At5g44950 isoform X1 [Lolium perenne]
MGKDYSRLSALPDDILLNILDRLGVLDAARTSILSRRWTQLAAKLSRLIINAQDFLPEGVSNVNVSDDEMFRVNAAAAEATKSILTRRNPGEHTIRVLSTAFYLRDHVPISIGQAVGRAVETHLVETAQFSVMTGKVGTDDVDDDELVIYGRDFMRFFEACPNAFGGLTSLDIENLRFGESDISNILITCKRLKHLRLLNCDSGDPSTLQVEHSHLSELSIVNCLLEQVKLNWLPQLTQMTFDGWINYQDPLVLGHVPLLKTVSLTNTGYSFHNLVKLSEFLCGTSIRDLKLGFKSEKVWVQPESLTKSLASVFHQLRFVNLVDLPEGYDLTWTMFILEAAPLLKELYITVWDHACIMETDEEARKENLYSEDRGVEWDSAAPDFQHHNLVTLIIFGYKSEDCMVSYLRRVMATAVNLKDVFLYGKLLCNHCQDEKPSRFPWTKRQKISLKKRVTAGIESFAIIRSCSTLRADHLAKIVHPQCWLDISRTTLLSQQPVV